VGASASRDTTVEWWGSPPGLPALQRRRMEVVEVQGSCVPRVFQSTPCAKALAEVSEPCAVGAAELNLVPPLWKWGWPACQFTFKVFCHGCSGLGQTTALKIQQ